MPDYARTTRTARTTWSADLEGGSGEVQLTSSRTGSYPITYYGRTAEDADGATSPEELLAAAYTASCAMQLTSLVARSSATAPGRASWAPTPPAASGSRACTSPCAAAWPGWTPSPSPWRRRPRRGPARSARP